jgi:hypothetical protein
MAVVVNEIALIRGFSPIIYIAYAPYLRWQKIQQSSVKSADEIAVFYYRFYLQLGLPNSHFFTVRRATRMEPAGGDAFGG